MSKSKAVEFNETKHQEEPFSWPFKPEQLEKKPCETASQCIGGKCPECQEDDEWMCENCDCWKKTREMCS